MSAMPTARCMTPILARPRAAQELRRDRGAAAASTSKVAPQELVFIIGPSGSGKSTLLRCCNRLEEPSGGAIIVRRRRPDGARDRHQRHAPQDRHGVPVVQSLSAHDRARQRDAGAAQGASASRAREADALGMAALDRVGLADKGASPIRPSCPAASSSASRSPARWRSSRRSMLFDEPTSALDPELVGSRARRDARARRPPA